MREAAFTNNKIAAVRADSAGCEEKCPEPGR